MTYEFPKLSQVIMFCKSSIITVHPKITARLLFFFTKAPTVVRKVVWRMEEDNFSFGSGLSLSLKCIVVYGGHLGQSDNYNLK